MDGLLNNPYIIYPGFPFSGYKDLVSYNNELNKLHYILDVNDIIEDEVVFMVIGAVMEELYSNLDEDIGDHWRQLFPYFLEKFIDDNMDKKISIIIVSPNKHFSCDLFKEPLFIKKTRYKYGWDNIADRLFIIKNSLITARILYTM